MHKEAAFFSDKVTLVTYSSFAENENPVWQTQVTPKLIDHVTLGEGQLIPIDTLPSDDPEFIMNTPAELQKNSTYQIWYGQKHHSLDFLLRCLEHGVKIQLWIDQPIIDHRDFLNLYISLSDYNNFELLYSPRMLHHPSEIFIDQIRPFINKLKVQMHTKKNKFDSWPSPDQLWLRLNWLRQNIAHAQISYQVFNQDFYSQQPHVQHFLETPTSKGYDQFVKFERPMTYLKSSVALSFSRIAGMNWLELLKLFLIWMRNPTRQSWNQLKGPIHLAISSMRIWRVKIFFKSLPGKIKYFISTLNLWRIQVALKNLPLRLKALFSAAQLWRLPVYMSRAAASLKLWQAKAFFKSLPGKIKYFISTLSLWRIQVALKNLPLRLKALFSAARLWRLPVLAKRSLAELKLWRLKIIAIRLGYIIMDFSWNVVCFPLRKIYWFTKFQFNKRILRRNKI